MKINMKIFKKYIVKLIEEGYYTLIKETMKKCFIKTNIKTNVSIQCVFWKLSVQ